MTQIRISVRNTSEIGGTFLTPTYFGFHDGSFDLFEAGEAASAGLEMLAEDGGAGGLAAERLAADADSQGVVVFGAAGPIATQEFTTTTLDVDGVSNGYVSLAAMILPSNDAFIGTDDAVRLFDEDGEFLGAQTLYFSGEDVYDAGTEVNTELDAAFINQTAPNTGIDENGVVRLHDGFNGSEGAGEGEGDQIILGGTNAAGAEIDAIAADFTRDGAEIATIHINTVNVEAFGRGGQVFVGGTDDDFVRGGRGGDTLLGGEGWDDLRGNNGRDVLDGGAGDDVLQGQRGRDILSGGSGDDILRGGIGNDVVAGGAGDDLFIFKAGHGQDVISDFDQAGDDVLQLSGLGVDSFADVQEIASETASGVTLAFDTGASLLLVGTELDDLSASDFVFV